MVKFLGEPLTRGVNFVSRKPQRGETMNRRTDMYAIIKTGGKQYKAEPGKFIDIEKLDVEVKGKVEFEALMVVEDGNVKVGTPVVEGVKVSGTVLKQDKEKKVIVYKYKPKKDYHKKQGHRQPFTRVLIDTIG